MRLALQNVYTPWVTPTASNPVGRRQAPRQPDRPRLLRRGATSSTRASRTFDLRYVRKTGKAGIERPGGEASSSFDASYSRETRNGNKNTTFYGGPDYEVATPIDYTTDDFRFGGELRQGRASSPSASVDFNKFRNDVPFAEIDNPERLEMHNPTNGRTVYQRRRLLPPLAAPRQQGLPGDFTGGVTLPKRHKITASLSTGDMTMDTVLAEHLDQPQPATSATAAQPGLHGRPALRQRRGASTTPSWAA